MGSPEPMTGPATEGLKDDCGHGQGIASGTGLPQRQSDDNKTETFNSETKMKMNNILTNIPPAPQQKVEPEDPMMDEWFRRWKTKMEPYRIKNDLARKMIAEFMGTFILVMFHNASVVQAVLSSGKLGSYFFTSWGCTIGLILALHWAWNVSGAHVNPAVSLGFAVVGKFPIRHVPHYALAQCLGAFTADVIIYGVYIEALNAFDMGNRQVFGPTGTGGMFCTYPAQFLTLQEGFFDQVVATGLLMSCILAVTDKRNNKPIQGMEPLIIGLILHGLGIGWGLNHGYAVNPAKDFSQRLFTYIAQWGPEVWTPYGVHWWWIPIIGPLVGAPIGAWIYYWLIEFQHPSIEEQKMDNQPMKDVNENEGMEDAAV